MPVIGNNSSGGKKPNPPTSVSASAGNASATVSFTQPTYEGKTGEATYVATSSPGSITGTSTTSPITVSSLSNGTAYTFTVIANTPYGVSSDISTASTSVSPAAPPPPPPPPPPPATPPPATPPPATPPPTTPPPTTPPPTTPPPTTPPPITYTVPNVVGLTSSQAQSAITAAGLSTGSFATGSNTSDPANEGKVQSQSPASGTVVSSGSSVNLTMWNYFAAGATYTTRGPDLGSNYGNCITGTTVNTGSIYVSPPGNQTVSNGSCGSVSWYAYTTGTWYYSCCQT
jgi:hypothetical protein